MLWKEIELLAFIRWLSDSPLLFLTGLVIFVEKACRPLGHYVVLRAAIHQRYINAVDGIMLLLPVGKQP